MVRKRTERTLKKRRKSHTRKVEEQCQEHLGRLRRLRHSAKLAHAGLLQEKHSTVRSHMLHAAMADAAHCEATCSALHRPSHRSAFYSPFAYAPPNAEFRPTTTVRSPLYGNLTKAAPCTAPPLTPNGIPTPDRTLDGSKAMHLDTAGKAARPTPFEHKCMKRRKFPLPLQGETICLGTR